MNTNDARKTGVAESGRARLRRAGLVLVPIVIATTASALQDPAAGGVSHASAEWWDPAVGNRVGAWCGASVGVLGGLFGCAGGICAAKGRAKGLILGSQIALTVIGLFLLCAAVVGLVLGQPFHVWYPLGLPGLILGIVMGALIPVMRARYREAEQRQLAAAELRRA
jgi:hypothetical protein